MAGNIPVFDGEGYEIWSLKMRTLFLSKELWNVVQQGYQEPDKGAILTYTEREKLRDCRKKDAEALYFIQQGVSSAIFPIIMESRKSNEAWIAIRNKFLGDHLEIIPDVAREFESPAIRNIDLMISRLSPIFSERCIFRVPSGLRRGNEEAYEPRVLAIGPYHRGNPRLTSMEEHKLRYLQELLLRMDYPSVEPFVSAIMPFAERVRKCYAEPIDSVSNDELVQMLVLDGCFIIELFRKNEMISRKNDKLHDDQVINSDVLMIELRKDLLLVENQIPFFVISILFDMTFYFSASKKNLSQLVLSFLHQKFPPHYWQTGAPLEFGDVSHLLSFTHNAICFGFSQSWSSPPPSTPCCLVNSATKLEEANLKLKAVRTGRNMFDIRFSKGDLEIPSVLLDDGFEIAIRNFVAFELCQPTLKQRYFCDYAIFMDYLIGSSDDVELLSHHGIIENHMIDDDSVDNMFKNLTKHVVISELYTYTELSTELNNHCKLPWNKWNANLKKNYFNTPWALISFLAALVLLLLTIAQTLFSILSYVAPPKS